MIYNIFSDENVFVKSSKVASTSRRLNERCKLLFKSINLKNKKILDLGCHNGRWMFAALKFGASFVTGVDNSRNYLNKAEENFKNYPEYKNKFTLKESDMLSFLKKEKFNYDVIFCFGVLYHTLEQLEILKECYRLNPKMLIVDTTVFNCDFSESAIDSNLKKYNLKIAEPSFYMVHKKNNIDKWEIMPSSKIVEIWIEKIGFKFEKLLNYDESITEKDYKEKQRITYHCTKLPFKNKLNNKNVKIL